MGRNWRAHLFRGIADTVRSVLLWARHGFDLINDLQFHAGTDAHRNENRTISAEYDALPMAA